MYSMGFGIERGHLNVLVILNLAEDLVLNPKDHPDAKIGDVVEIYHPEDESTRLLLQITCFNEDIKGTRGMRRQSFPNHMILLRRG